jgi:hypothetical protein
MIDDAYLQYTIKPLLAKNAAFLKEVGKTPIILKDGGQPYKAIDLRPLFNHWHDMPQLGWKKNAFQVTKADLKKFTSRLVLFLIPSVGDI